MRALVLNVGYEPLQIISWERAICLVFSDKAEILVNTDKVARTISHQYFIPGVIRLKRYIRVSSEHFGIVRCSRRNILIRDQFQCQYCGKKCRQTQITIDHVMPRSRGGKSSWDNLVAACIICNHKKSANTPAEKGMVLRKHPRRPLWTEMLEEMERDLIDLWSPYIYTQQKSA